MAEQDKPISTSALARELDKPTRQMFAELEALGWIKRQDESWLLTAKGEFEGGQYRDSDKFGRYITWPVSVCKHPALVSADAELLTSLQLAKALDLPVRQLRQLLQLLGWQQPARRGWVLTPRGIAMGGCQRENTQTGVPFILWAPAIQTSSALLTLCQRYSDQAADAQGVFAGLDGHRLRLPALKQIDDWLFLAGLQHATDWPLPLDETLSADFYLSVAGIFIEYWQPDADAATLKQMMRKRELYRQHQLPCIEIQAEDLAQLDESLRRALLRFDIEV